MTDSPTPPEFHIDFADDMSYGDYLRLDSLLACQSPISDSHDETLFIIIHQATELWLKLVLHELTAAMAHIRQDDLGPALKMLARVSRIQEQLVQSWSVLSTMTPTDYLRFRDRLGHASGFQSHQFRSLEFLLGNRDVALLAPFRHSPQIHGALDTILSAPSLYDECLKLLDRRGFALAPQAVERDWRQSYTVQPSVATAWLAIYQDTDQHWDLYELAEELVDLEDAFQTWRFRHLNTVARIIGHKRGTGGTTGVDYLRRALDIRIFPELWDVRTAL